MIKVLHTADLHVGWENYSRPTERGLSSCLMAFKDTLAEISQIAQDEDVDLVVIAGDLYKMRDPSQTYQAIVAETIVEIAKDHDIPIVIVPGNHDLPGNLIKAGTTDIFAALLEQKVYVLASPALYPIKTKSGPIWIAPLPWLRPCDIAAEDVPDLAAGYQRRLDVLASDAREEPNVPAILVGHLTVANARPGSEAGMMLGKDPIIPVAELARPGFDAVMLGHIHNGQVWDGQYPVVAYCGSPQALDFSDEGDQKHVIIWQIEKGNTTVKDVPLKSTRRFLTIDREVDGMFVTPDNLGLLGVLSSEDGTKREVYPDVRDAIVRVNVTVPKHLAGEIDNNAIHKALEGAAWVQINKRVLQDNAPVRDVATLAGMTPIQALEKYCQDKALTPGFQEEVLATAARLTKGE